MDLNLVDTAFKLLTSKDDVIKTNALCRLKATVRFRNRKLPNDDDIGQYMSGVILDDFLPHSNDFSNTWTAARSASNRLGVHRTFEEASVRLQFQDIEIRANSKRRVMHTIRERQRADRTAALICTTHTKARLWSAFQCPMLAHTSSPTESIRASPCGDLSSGPDGEQSLLTDNCSGKSLMTKGAECALMLTAKLCHMSSAIVNHVSKL
ncbi:hypothetical protein AVEN_61827-1 [Araneus ventricosus]|uniref:Uncharacterized protein n=1 Tax=Araneus ventricosus TaxID=182803 RepID=A0A4Y2LRK5_ARAVE|nr:hypothetical protein AVEN_61827-1 [Araneus ventricosus]